MLWQVSTPYMQLVVTLRQGETDLEADQLGVTQSRSPLLLVEDPAGFCLCFYYPVVGAAISLELHWLSTILFTLSLIMVWVRITGELLK